MKMSKNKLFKYLLVFLVIIFILFINNISYVSAVGINLEDTNVKILEFKKVVDFFSNIAIAFSLLTSVLLLIIHFIRLAGSNAHPLLRHDVIRDIGVTGIITASIGAIGLLSKLVAATVL